MCQNSSDRAVVEKTAQNVAGRLSGLSKYLNANEEDEYTRKTLERLKMRSRTSIICLRIELSLYRVTGEGLRASAND